MVVAESSRKVLVVEPDNSTRREIRVACEQDGYLVVEADAGSEALRQVESSRPNVVLLEVTLPDAAGFDVCRELRKMDPGVPVIMMSTRSDEIDAVVALEIGADDYVTKPLRLRELVARMAAHLRRARLENAEAMRSRLEFRDLTIDVNERRTYKAGKEVELTHTEFDLLTFLASNAGKVLSREKILNSHPQPTPQDRDAALASLLHPCGAGDRLPLHERAPGLTPSSPSESSTNRRAAMSGCGMTRSCSLTR